MFSILVLALSIARADAPAQIKNMAGCFSITYRFVEDGKHELDISGTFEELLLEARPDGSYFLQHYGIMQGQKIKHFGEQWTPKDDGTWHQKVVSPSGSLRYECRAPFIFNQYKCTALNAPKPNRDSERHDYETIDREITLQITPNTSIQQENNIKRDASGGFVSNELGWIEMRRVDQKNCL